MNEKRTLEFERNESEGCGGVGEFEDFEEVPTNRSFEQHISFIQYEILSLGVLHSLSLKFSCILRKYQMFQFGWAKFQFPGCIFDTSEVDIEVLQRTTCQKNKEDQDWASSRGWKWKFVSGVLMKNTIVCKKDGIPLSGSVCNEWSWWFVFRFLDEEDSKSSFLEFSVCYNEKFNQRSIMNQWNGRLFYLPLSEFLRLYGRVKGWVSSEMELKWVWRAFFISWKEDTTPLIWGSRRMSRR